MGGYKLDLAGSGLVLLASCCEHGKKRSGVTKDGELMTSWATVSFVMRTLFR